MSQTDLYVRAMQSHQIIAGETQLVFACHYPHPWARRRPFVVGFKVAGEEQGYLLFVDDRELIDFSRFRRRVLEESNIFVRHAAESKDSTAVWLNDVEAACLAGKSVDPNKSEGYRLLGGQQ